MSDYKNVVILIETREGAVAPISYELIAAGRKLADGLGQELGALILDEGVGDSQVEKLTARGVDVVYRAKGASFLDGNHANNVSLLEQAVRKIAPMLFLLGGSDKGNAYAPSVAARLEAGLLTNCIDGRVNDQKAMLLSRAVYCGKAIATYEICAFPHVATIKQKSFTAAEPVEGATGRVEEIEMESPGVSSGAKLVETVTEEEGAQLEDAKIIVCAGGGIGGTDGLSQVKDLADKLNGLVGATKVPCDEGWVPKKTYIGQTGKVVNPDLYIAVGVSGATQHITGVLGSKCIVAINRDAEAPIFKYSDYGIVGDFQTVLPVLIEELGR